MRNPFSEISKVFQDGELVVHAWACGMSHHEFALTFNDNYFTFNKGLFLVLMEWLDDYFIWDTQDNLIDDGHFEPLTLVENTNGNL